MNEYNDMDRFLGRRQAVLHDVWRIKDLRLALKATMRRIRQIESLPWYYAKELVIEQALADCIRRDLRRTKERVWRGEFGVDN